MAQFKFCNPKDCDPRSDLVNFTCNLLIQKHKGNIHLAAMEAKPFFKMTSDTIRNVYELIDSQIPLMSYFKLVMLGAENFDFTEDEYQSAISDATKACSIYYPITEQTN